MIMADTSLGRASLSVTADLSGFVSSLDAAAAKSASLGNTFTATSTSSNRVTTSTSKQWAAMTQLEKAAVISAASQKALTTQTDIANRKLDIQARQMLIDSGAAAKLAKELTALEKAEAKLASQEEKINRAAGRSGGEQQKKDAKGGLKITDMLGIGFFTAGFTKLFDGAISFVKSLIGSIMDLGSKVIEAGSKFQELDNRLKALSGFSGLAKGLQGIMRAGPSASFTALGESATRLSALQFNPEALQGMIEKFNSLGVALGNPEKILNLIVDKIGDMASEGSATMGALGKLAEEGIPVFEALASRMGVSVEEAKRRVKDGLVSVTEGTQAIADAANMPGMIAAAQQSANSFMGVWSRVTNNIEVMFQTIGASILKGFGLVEMGESITSFFDGVFLKVEELKPIFERIGAFASSVTQLILDELSQLMFGWKSFSDDQSAENMMETMKGFAEQLVAVLRELVNYLLETADAARKASKDFSWWANLGSNTAQGLQNWVVDPLINVAAATGEFVLNVGEWSDGIETIGNGANSAANQLGKLNDEMQNTLHWSAQLPMDNLFTGTGGSFQSDLEAMNEELKAFDEQWNELANAKPLMLELPKWQKFLDENKTPLQIYENELERLNLMLDGTEQGFQAFAIGSANALKKLKEATGLGEVKFAAAITAGSAEDFKATLDAQNQNVDVQQQIREIMAQAAVIQQAQLNAQIQIAQGIQNLRPPKPVNVMAN